MVQVLGEDTVYRGKFCSVPGKPSVAEVRAMKHYTAVLFTAGVGGIEAEAVMLGQPISMVLPQVIGYRLMGKPHPLVTSTDIVLTITKVRICVRICVIYEHTQTHTASWKANDKRNKLNGVSVL